MNFRDYQWFKNPRGLRNNGPYLAIKPERYTRPRMGWARLVAGGTEHLDTVKSLVAQNCMPIISIYRERMGAAPAPNAWYDLYLQYIDAGALWFEFYEEPNSPQFWPLSADGRPAITPDWNSQECIQPLMDNWLVWAEHIIKLGGYPAFPALAETTEPALATVKWLEICLLYLKEVAAERFIKLLDGGLWLAAHPFVMNHYYQEPPGGPVNAQRPHYQQSAAEEGWHFEYPYDPVQQHADPGRSPFGGTAQSPFGDPNGLVAAGEAFQELLRNMFNAGPIPVIGTAGGIHPIPAPNADPVQQDARYLSYDRDSHGEATLAMFQWIARHGPPWFFGVALSTEADYYSGPSLAPAIELLLNRPPVLKEIPDLDTTHGIAMSAAPPAPEPAASSSPVSPETPPAPQPVMNNPEPPSPISAPTPMLPAMPLPQLLQEPPPPPPSEPIALPSVMPPAAPSPNLQPIPMPPSSPSMEARGAGPGPVSGAPDYHWLLLAPDLPEDWFWDVAWRYWDAFRPTLIPSTNLIGGVPPENSLAVTVIAPTSALDALKQSIHKDYPNVKIDAIAADDQDALQTELERRAQIDQEYGE